MRTVTPPLHQPSAQRLVVPEGDDVISPYHPAPFLYHQVARRTLGWPYNARYASTVGGAIEISLSASQADDVPLDDTRRVTFLIVYSDVSTVTNSPI